MPSRPSRIVVIIASTGRPVELSQIINHLSLQSRRPDRIIASIANESDAPPGIPAFVEVIQGPKGLCSQRNRGLDVGLTDSDIVVFFDDDYLPAKTALEAIEYIFGEYPDIVGLNGTLLSDGIKTAGISYEDAVAMVTGYDQRTGLDALMTFEPLPNGLYGCNMIYRSTAIADTRFDEKLPLYGWQEDIDFSVRIGQRGGKLVKTNAFSGVHRGTKGGRTSGKRLGYSQVINPIYLYRKGTMNARFASELILRNFASNALKVFRPEAWIDRRGRLIGNLMGFADLVCGKVDPMAVMQI
jgi:GT2 family glycosyltransferase